MTTNCHDNFAFRIDSKTMKIFFLSFVCGVAPLASAFAPSTIHNRKIFALKGYLDDLSNQARAPETSNPPPSPSQQGQPEQTDRFGVGSWEGFQDFEEFDGGDGQMGVAGDGKKGLDKEWQGAAEFAKSKTMSAKNAWGRATGYADELIAKGVEATRAQQIENWRNQREVQEERANHRFTTDEFDKSRDDEDWRNLSTFGGERLKDTDIDQELGAVVPGQVTDTIEMTSRVNRAEVFEFKLKVSRD